MCDLLVINISKSKVTSKTVIIFWVSACFVPTFRRNVMPLFHSVLICGCINVFGFLWSFDVILPQTFISEMFSFCHQFTIHLNKFSRSEYGVSIFLRNTGTSKWSCVLQKHKERLLFEQHTPCRFEDLLLMCNSLSSCIKINVKISII
jgi:hypothetical protein